MKDLRLVTTEEFNEVDCNFYKTDSNMRKPRETAITPVEKFLDGMQNMFLENERREQNIQRYCVEDFRISARAGSTKTC